MKDHQVLDSSSEDVDSTTRAGDTRPPALNRLPPSLEELRCIGPKELAQLIGRSEKCIKIDVSRRPETLPPRFVIPGTRKVQWRIADVRRWMDGIMAVQHRKDGSVPVSLRRKR